MTEPRNPAPQPSAGETPALIARLRKQASDDAMVFTGSTGLLGNREKLMLKAADALSTSEQEKATLRYALVKVRAHTSYANTSKELLTGLLASIERIVDAALSSTGPNTETR